MSKPFSHNVQRQQSTPHTCISKFSLLCRNNQCIFHSINHNNPQLHVRFLQLFYYKYSYNCASILEMASMLTITKQLYVKNRRKKIFRIFKHIFTISYDQNCPTPTLTLEPLTLGLCELQQFLQSHQRRPWMHAVQNFAVMQFVGSIQRRTDNLCIFAI